MKRAIVLVDHGSRIEAANAQLETLADQLRERFPDRLVECAHLEIVEPTLAQAVARCVEAGAEEIVVHPFFLGPGRHSRRDIPALVSEATALHPGVRIVATEPLGLHPSVVDAVADRIDSTR